MEAKLNELLVKFSALRDRISERDKLHNEVDTLAKQVEQNKSRATNSRNKDVNSAGEKMYEIEALYEQKKDEYVSKHSALLRELQQYNENRLDILSAILLDFFAAQKYFAYSYGRSLYELHDQLREADEKSAVALPKPSWQMLMTYVTQTEEGRAVQTGEIRPSLIMRMAGEQYEASGGQRQQAAARMRPTAVSPPPKRTFTKPDSFATADDVAFNPHVLVDPTNQPYLPLSVMMNTRDKRDAAVAAGKAGEHDITAQTADGAPAVRRGGPPPTLAEPQPVTPATFTALHSSLAAQGSDSGEGVPQQQRSGGEGWAAFDSFPSSSFPASPSPKAAASNPFSPAPPPPPPKSRPTSSADFDILSMPFTPSQPPPTQPPPPQPAPPSVRPPSTAPPPPASRQPPPPASRVKPAAPVPPPVAVAAESTNPFASPQPFFPAGGPGGPNSPPPPRSATSPPPPSQPPPPASRTQPGPPPPQARSSNPWDAPVSNPWDAPMPGFPTPSMQPPPPAARPPPPPSPHGAVSPRGANGAFGFPAPPPPPPAGRTARSPPPAGPPPPQARAPPQAAAKKAWSPFDDDD